MTAPTLRADPLADATIAAILGEEHESCADAAHWEAIATVNRQFAQWETNGDLQGWRALPGTPEHIANALEAYVRDAMRLPDWADPAKIARAEAQFMELSMMSCTLLFCASLPQCYVIPDLAAVLHSAGQLEAHTDYRIRSTAAMIFPVMMRGGLTTPQGGGVAQVLKVRLIHATIRHLILRGSPEAALREGPARIIPALEPVSGGMYQALFAQGWDIGKDGLPCNQEELAYTLLTFNYVYLRGMRDLGIGFRQEDEEAYLHAWNVMGHVLGIERELMAETMAEAEALFARLQASGRLHPWLPDPRPDLAAALMNTMEQEIPFRLLKPFPVLLTRYLCGKTTSADLALNTRVSLVSRALFYGGMLLVRGFDALVRLALPDFSICRLLGRIVGYQFTVKVLMDQTRPLKLPTALLNQVNDVLLTWDKDPKAPNWVNKLEQRFTTQAKPAPATESPA